MRIAFHQVASLSVLFEGSPSGCPFSTLVALLDKFSIESLSLVCFSAVSLCRLSKCELLCHLSLQDCTLVNDLGDRIFPVLESLQLSSGDPRVLNLLLTVCPALESLQLRHMDAVAHFLQARFPKRRLQRLVTLELWVKEPLKALGVSKRCHDYKCNCG